MSFSIAADAYDRFMGRYSVPLAPYFASFAGIEPGQRVLDVGSGPGALTTELVRRVGVTSVSAVDPSASFVEAIRDRLAGVSVELASAEHLPFPDHAFNAVLAQLVVHFMPDPVAGLKEMARVTRSGGRVAACVWDHAGGQGPLGLFWDAARTLDPGIEDEGDLPGAREGHLETLFEAAGFRKVEAAMLSVSVTHETFDAWWKPFTLGVGPAGTYTASLDPDRQEELRELCRARSPDEPFVVTARAWAARALA